MSEYYPIILPGMGILLMAILVWTVWPLKGDKQDTKKSDASQNQNLK